jgi:hypothetical protein
MMRRSVLISRIKTTSTEIKMTKTKRSLSRIATMKVKKPSLCSQMMVLRNSKLNIKAIA